MSKIRVLLADDVPDIRSLLRLAVERDGRFEVVGEASDGVEAVELAKQHQPDLVVLDVAMPKMDGLQAIPKVREHLAENGRIVVVSGFTSDTVGPRAIEICADAYLEKGKGSIRSMPDFFARVLDAPRKALAFAG